MTVALSGRINQPLQKAAELLSECATWRTLGGWANAAAALAVVHVYDWAVEEDENGVPLAMARPAALVDWASDFARRRIAQGQSGTYVSEGTILLWLEVDVPGTYLGVAGGVQDSLRWWGNQLGAIVEELEAVGGVSGRLSFSRVRVGWVARSSESNGEEQFLQGVVMLEVG